MTTHDWISLLGVGVSALLTIGPWLFALHGKLAVIGNQVTSLCEQVEKLSNAHQQRWEMCVEHQSRLDTQEVKLEDVADRLREVE
jgi:hypothetical protein